MSTEIPIFFSTDDNYVPFLDVAVSSLISNASRDYNYRIIVLNTGLCEDSIKKVKQNERDGFTIEFFDISEHIESIKSHFKNVYHFSVVTYYRLFIASLFPQYDKILYLDSDLVVLGDVSELYNTPLGENILGAVSDTYVKNTPEFRTYAQKAIGVSPDDYFNAGVLVINLNEFRKNNIEEKFTRLVTEHNFDLLDPDQAYLNFLCNGKVYKLQNGWNKVPAPTACEGKKNIVHYALYKKPWQYDDVIDGEHFWRFAKNSPFYSEILNSRASFGEKEKAEKEAAAQEIIKHAAAIVASDYTLCKKIHRS